MKHYRFAYKIPGTRQTKILSVYAVSEDAAILDAPATYPGYARYQRYEFLGGS